MKFNLLKLSTDEFHEEISFIFGLREKIGALADALKIFEVNITNRFV